MASLRFTSSPGHGYLHVPLRRFLDPRLHAKFKKLYLKRWRELLRNGTYLASATTVFLEEDCQARAWLDATGDTIGASRHVEDGAADRCRRAGSYASPDLMRAYLEGGPCRAHVGDGVYRDAVLQPQPNRCVSVLGPWGGRGYSIRKSTPFVGLKGRLTAVSELQHTAVEERLQNRISGRGDAAT